MSVYLTYLLGASLVDTIRSLVTDFDMFTSSWHVKALGLGSGHTALWLCVLVCAGLV